jgi:predicted acyltransferase
MAEAPVTTVRLDSLDVFRGVTIAAMILVSTPGTWNAVYGPLDHAAWNGWTPTDLIFPFLLFAMGAAVPIALARRRVTSRRVRGHVMRRALVLFALGLLLNAIETDPLRWATFRLPGVLQRIAIVYAVVALVTEKLTRRAQVAVAVIGLMGYWAAMAFVPVPGVGAGVLTPTGNLASFIDRAVIGHHLLNAAFDPEGLLSTIPAVVTALGGVFAGDWLKEPRQRHRGAWLWAAGVAATLVGLVWSPLFPINKNLWTSSFALLSAGMAAQALALCHWLIDVKHRRAWSTPFAAFGRNPLAAYCLSIGFDSVLTRLPSAGAPSLKTAIYRAGFASWLVPCCGGETASLAYALTYVTFWGLILTMMYHRRIFIGI